MYIIKSLLVIPTPDVSLARHLRTKALSFSLSFSLAASSHVQAHLLTCRLKKNKKGRIKLGTNGWERNWAARPLKAAVPSPVKPVAVLPNDLLGTAFGHCIGGGEALVGIQRCSVTSTLDDGAYKGHGDQPMQVEAG